MVLSNDKKTAVLKNDFKNFNYIVLDVSDFTLGVKKTSMEWCIELLNLIRRATQANDIYKLHDQKKIIDTGILHKAIDAVMKDEPFTEAQAKEYVETRMEICRFFDKYIDLVRPSGLNLNFEIDLFLFGAGFDRENDDIPEGTKYSWSTLMYDLELKTLSIDEFMAKSRELIEEKKQLAEVD